MASVLSSVLEEVIKSFVGNAFKKQTILNALKNRGVKDIELEQSGMKKFIEEYKGEKIPVAELEAVTKVRPDNLKVKQIPRGSPTGDPNKPYANIREAQFSNPTAVPYDTLNTAHIHRAETATALRRLADPNLTAQYNKEELRQILIDTSNTGSKLTNEKIDLAISQYKETMFPTKINGKYNIVVQTKDMPHGIQNHFNTPEYYSHVRYTDVPNDARYVHEIQSDVHAAGDKGQLSDDAFDAVIEHAQDIYGRHFNMDFFDDHAYANIQDLIGTARGREFMNLSKNEQHDIITKDFGGSISVDHQGEEAVQIVEDMAAQITAANQQLKEFSTPGAKFQKDPKWLNSTINKTLVDAANESQKVVKVRIAPDKNLMRAEGVQKWYEDTVSPTLQKTAKKIGAEAKMTDDGYMEVKLPEKDFSLPLYSATGIGVLSATTATKAQAAELPGKIKEARDAGYSDEEIQAFTKDKYDPNVLQRSFNPTQGAQ